jgi:hypothetical protein
MSDPFENYLREAVVVIDAERTELLRSGVRALSGVRETVPTILVLVRLAHGLPVTSPELEAFLASATSVGLSIKRGDDQLAGTLAMLTLIERFAIPLARRTLNTLTPDAVAAVATIVLAEQQRPAMHPDLAIHAADWQARAADYLRGTARWSAPPELTKPSAPASGTDGEPPPPPETSTPELVDHAEKLTNWLRQTSSSAKLAAVEEQQDIVLWLMSARPAGSAVQAVQLACMQLQGLAANPIGPPGTQQLLTRALGTHADESISVAELMGNVVQPLPLELRELCTLLAGKSPGPDVTLTAREAASRLYHELQLVRLVSPPETA